MAISIFMEIPDIEGGCDVMGREGMMECLEMTHQVYSPIDTTTGAITGCRVHTPVKLTKMTDKATPEFFKYMCTGREIPSIFLHYFTINKDGVEEEYFKVELKSARVVSVEPVMYNTRQPEFEKMPHLETISFGYQEIVWTELGSNIEHMDNYRNDST